jgi:hypothetical protein
MTRGVLTILVWMRCQSVELHYDPTENSGTFIYEGLLVWC